MKKLLIALLVIPFLFSCSEDDPNIEPTPEPQETSFVFIHHFKTVAYQECMVGYLKDGKWIKIAELGMLIPDIPSKKVIIKDGSISDVYFFSLATSTDQPTFPTVRLDHAFIINKNRQNTFTIEGAMKFVEVDKNDQSQYPL